MKLRTHAFSVAVSALGLSFFAILSGCSKSDAAGSTNTTSAKSGAAACAESFVRQKPTSTDADKKTYTSLCEAISPKASACIAAAKDKSDLDGCIVDKADKDKMIGAIMGAAMEADKAAAKTSKATKLEKLGLQIDVPGEVNVSDGIGKNDVMILNVAVGGLTIGEVTKSTPKTLKAAKAEATIFKPKNVKGETTADGYWLTFENTGSLGTNYWVKTIRQINGKSYECAGSPDSAEKATAALAACNSLRP